MSIAKSFAATVAGIAGFVTTDHITDDDLDALAEAVRDTLRAIEIERADRLASRCGRLPVSYPWPGDAA